MTVKIVKIVKYKGYMKMQENKIYFDGTEMFFTVMEKMR